MSEIDTTDIDPLKPRPPHEGSARKNFSEIKDNLDLIKEELETLELTRSISNGGTGETTPQNAINTLSQVQAATDEYVLTKDTSTGDAIWKLGGGGGGVWGSITGTLSNQTDLQNELDGKEDADATILKDADIGVNVQAYALTLAIADGGTGQDTAQEAIDALTQVSGATDEHILTKDTATGNAVWKTGGGGGGDAHYVGEGTPSTLPSATGTDSLAMGDGASAINTANIAIGFNATADNVVGDYKCAIGATADATGDQAIAIGRVAKARERDTIAIGFDAQAGQTEGATAEFSAIAIGEDAKAYENNCIAIGANTIAGTLGSSANPLGIAIGGFATAKYFQSIAIGWHMDATKSYEAVLGACTEWYFGLYGAEHATPNDVLISSTRGLGTDIGGAELALAGGRSTGTGNGGDVVLKIALPTTTSATLNTLEDAIRISGTTGVINLSNVPTSASGLSTGDIWANSGVLTIV